MLSKLRCVPRAFSFRIFHSNIVQYSNGNSKNALQVVVRKYSTGPSVESQQFLADCYSSDERYKKLIKIPSGSEQTISPQNNQTTGNLSILRIKLEEWLQLLSKKPQSLWRQIVLHVFAAVIFATVFVFAFNTFKPGDGKNALGLDTTNNWKQVTATDVSFNDIKGIDSVKHELEVIVDFLKNPEKFAEADAKIPKGYLLYGPPGTGKTLLARAIASEAGANFLFANASTFEDFLVGVGSRRVSNLFKAARKNKPCIIYIDEIDALAVNRDNLKVFTPSLAVNQLLSELDGFSPTDRIIFICSSNRPEALDKAFLRPGRIDKMIQVPLPDKKGREEIIDYYLSKVKSEYINTHSLAAMTIGLSGAQIKNIVNQAAIKAVLQKSPQITQENLESALADELIGIKSPTLLTPEAKKKTAYHESGHAIVSLMTPYARNVFQATILPRGDAAGLVVTYPESEYSTSKAQLLAYIDTCLAGKIAEEIFYGKDNVSSGCASDNQAAISAAHQFLDSGFGSFGYIGKTDSDLSPATRAKVDHEILKIMGESRERVTKLLTTRRTQVEVLVNALLEKETLTGEEIEEIMKPHLTEEEAQKLNVLRVPTWKK